MPVTTFSPDGTVESYPVAALDLCQTPPAQITIRVMEHEYVVTVQRVPDDPEIQIVDQPVWTTDRKEAITAHPDALRTQLESFLQQGILRLENGRLRLDQCW